VFDHIDAIVHLAGEPVAQRWNYAVKKRIRSSRVDVTRALVESLCAAPAPPRVLICASAVGYYGDRGEEELTESSPPGKGFLAEVCQEWEKEAKNAQNCGVRVVNLRIATVLDPRGGALARMLPPFRLGLGGPIAGGQAWMSWIHVNDLVRLIAWALDQEQVSGAVNACAPAPVRNAAFTRALAAALHRPAKWSVPALALKLFYGEMAQILLASQRVLPARAMELGFPFEYNDIDEALRDLLSTHKSLE
jgi:uncharacterized protein (TIGR01777 family)